MELGKAVEIFYQIRSDKYTEAEKYKAIGMVLNMATHNSIKKETIIDVFKWVVLEDREIVEAIKKIVPEKPCYFDNDFGYYRCPNCGEIVGFIGQVEEHKYCPCCGQAIDWSEDNSKKNLNK